MAKKVFILSDLIGQNVDGADIEITSYWINLSDSVKFIAHKTYLYRLCSTTGYFAIKVLKMKNKQKVDIRWISFNINNVGIIEINPFAPHYFVIKKEALDALLKLDLNADSLGIEIGKREEDGKIVCSIIIGPGTFVYSDGGGGTTPGAGVKLP
jgi:hypothetical protein